MDDSDDDIIFVDEIRTENNKSNNWKWKALNPIVKSGVCAEILRNVRAKLKMETASVPILEQNKLTSNGKKEDGVISKKDSITSGSSASLTQGNVDNVPKTPLKTSTSEAPLALSPEEIQELTENCLDSDNEPEMTPVKISDSLVECAAGQSQSSLKRALDFNVKASSSLRNRASKYFGAGTSKPDVEEILLQESGLKTRSPSKSPSPKKRRLSKNSPIRFLPSHRNLGKSPNRLSPAKRNLGNSPNKLSPAKRNLGISPNKLAPENKITSGQISDGPYYYEALCYMVKEVCDNPLHKHLFLDSELEKLKLVSTSKKEFQLYARLINRKDKWNRSQDISYGDISSDLSPLFDFLEDQGLILCDVGKEKLDVLLCVLKVEELRSLCVQFKVKKTGNKKDLMEALLSTHRTQPTLAGESPLHKSVLKMLGRCIRLALKWRLVFRRCILLFSLFHSFEDLDKLSSEQALLYLQVRKGNMVFPVDSSNIHSETRIFSNRDQLIRFEEAKECSQEMNVAIETKNFAAAKALTDGCRRQLATLLQLPSETNHVLQLPQFLQKFCAGSIFVNTLTRSVEILKMMRNYPLALQIVDVLLNQKIYGLNKRGKWSLMKVQLLQTNLKRIVEACQELCNVLEDKSTLNPVDCMLLQERAVKVYKLKKNGLSTELKIQLKKVMDRSESFSNIDSVEIPARALPSSKVGLKKVYVKDIEDGKEFMSVEEVVISHYKSLGFWNGLHDEGSTISSLCLLSLWNHIYDTTVPSVFLSPYQDKPLDWGSKAFYESRKNAIESHFSSLLSQDLKSIADELYKLRDQHCHTTSVVNWNRLEQLDILAFLQCISISVFIAVARRFVQDWRSHRKGFPDLVIWSPPQKKSLFIEVKSPNDTLSTVQCMWLEFLKENNAKAIVAHIRESGSKSTTSALSTHF